MRRSRLADAAGQQETCVYQLARQGPLLVGSAWRHALRTAHQFFPTSLQVLRQSNSLNLLHIAIRRGCVLMKEVRQVLEKLFFGNEVRHDELGRSTLAVRAKPKRRPNHGFTA